MSNAEPVPTGSAGAGDSIDPALARAVAYVAHAGQVDKAGQPYIHHPRRVAEAVTGHGPIAQCVAWLHDVVEDTTFTLDDLATQFHPDIVEAVNAITRREREMPNDYYARVLANPVAVIVKRADVAANSSPERLALLDDKTRERLTKKYAKALTVLGAQ